MWFPHPCILLEQMPEAFSVLPQVAITKNRNQTHLRWNAFVPASHTACFTVEKLQNIFHRAKNSWWAQWHQVYLLNISFYHTLTITHRFRPCFLLCSQSRWLLITGQRASNQLGWADTSPSAPAAGTAVSCLGLHGHTPPLMGSVLCSASPTACESYSVFSC